MACRGPTRRISAGTAPHSWCSERRGGRRTQFFGPGSNGPSAQEHRDSLLLTVLLIFASGPCPLARGEVAKSLSGVTQAEYLHGLLASERVRHPDPFAWRTRVWARGWPPASFSGVLRATYSFLSIQSRT